jgi:hypothetical protein
LNWLATIQIARNMEACMDKFLILKDRVLDFLTLGYWSRWQGEKRFYVRVRK